MTIRWPWVLVFAEYLKLVELLFEYVQKEGLDWNNKKMYCFLWNNFPKGTKTFLNCTFFSRVRLSNLLLWLQSRSLNSEKLERNKLAHRIGQFHHHLTCFTWTSIYPFPERLVRKSIPMDQFHTTILFLQKYQKKIHTISYSKRKCKSKWKPIYHTFRKDIQSHMEYFIFIDNLIIINIENIIFV